MRKLSFLSCLLAFIGAFFLLFSHYIDVKIAGGKSQIALAEQKTTDSSSFFTSSRTARLMKAQIEQTVKEAKLSLLFYENASEKIKLVSYSALFFALFSLTYQYKKDLRA
ncbi:MAG: hypothetical protein QRY71_01980 [Candidatus Rhabdochlamydia sp.]